MLVLVSANLSNQDLESCLGIWHQAFTIAFESEGAITAVVDREIAKQLANVNGMIHRKDNVSFELSYRNIEVLMANIANALDVALYASDGWVVGVSDYGTNLDLTFSSLSWNKVRPVLEKKEIQFDSEVALERVM